MPAKPQWFTRIPEILDLVRAMTVPVLDREVFEGLFGVRRRRAISLMHSYGGYSSGNSLLVNRDDLLVKLRAIEDSSEVLRENVRKEKLAKELQELHRSRAGAAIVIGTRRSGSQAQFGIPQSIRIEPGRIIVSFGSPEELFKTLYEFGQAAANDYDSVRSALEDST